MENKKYTVYMHICPNNKKYIGITKQKPEDRWINGKGYKDNNYFYKAINKYNWNNIEHKILYTNLTKEKAEQKEIELIAYYKSNEKEFGYNIESGGHVNCVSDNTKKKISQTMKEKGIYKDNPNCFKKGNKPWIMGKKHTEETKNKIKEKRAKQKIKANKIVCVETGKIFESAKQIEEKYGFKANNIRHVCEGNKKTSGGYHWKYINPKNRKNKKYN